MVEVAKYTLVLIAIINAAIVVVPYLMGRAELMSIRNFFLLGFTIYQVTSGVICLHNPANFASEIALSQPADTSLKFVIWVIVFEAVFLAAYRWGIGAKRLARWTPIIQGEAREPILWLFAFTLLGAAALLRLSVFIPYVSILTSHIGTSVAAVAAGLGAWIWVRRPLNPAAAAFMFLVLFLAIAIGITGVFGRRPIVAIAACIGWGTYYSRWRNLHPATVLARAAIFGIIPVVLVAKYTTVRGNFYQSSEGPFSRMMQIAEADTMTGLVDLVSGQECAAWSMYLMQMYPEYHEYRHMHAIKYYFQFSVPRAIWPDKPHALAEIAWVDADIPGMPDGFTIGPGIIGHAASEGGFYALLIYATALGLFVRYFDSVLARAPMQPFVALPIGASMGNLLGIPRGETPNFAYEFTVGVLGSLVILIIVARLLKAMGFITNSDFNQPGLEGDTHHADGSTDGLYDPNYTASYGSDPESN